MLSGPRALPTLAWPWLDHSRSQVHRHHHLEDPLSTKKKKKKSELAEHYMSQIF